MMTDIQLAALTAWVNAVAEVKALDIVINYAAFNAVTTRRDFAAAMVDAGKREWQARTQMYEQLRTEATP